MKFSLAIIFSLIFTAGCGHHMDGYRNDSSRHHFSDTEKYATMFESPDRDAWQKPGMVVSKTGVKKGDRVADIGAGTGYFTRRFAAAVGPDGIATGYDIEPGMVEYMKKDALKLKLNSYRAETVDADNPGLPDNYFNLVFLNNTYHHINNRPEYFRNIKKSLKKDGKVVIVDFQKRDMPYGPPTEMKLSKETIVDEMKKAGYELKSDIDFLPNQYFLEFR